MTGELQDGELGHFRQRSGFACEGWKKIVQLARNSALRLFRAAPLENASSTHFFLVRVYY